MAIRNLHALYLDAAAGIFMVFLGLMIGVMLYDSYLLSTDGLIITSLFMFLFLASLKDYRDRGAPRTFLGKEELFYCEKKVHFWSKKAQRNLMLIAIAAIPAGWIFKYV